MTTFDNQTGRLAPQSLLQQRYMIVGLAGRGGMSAVYQGVDTRLQRRVAIKEMSQARLSQAEIGNAEAHFQQEARMLSALMHPNLPRIYDAFSEQGRSYLVMDFIEGKTLHQIIKEAQGQPLPVAQVLGYALQLCDVLGYLHQQHPPIIFRDVKPSNIMITPDGHVFLIDFGIARFFKEEQALDTVFLGSPGYAAPEQHGTAQTNPRADIYSLGATLHYCLTGHDPYYATQQFMFAPIRTYNPHVPVDLDQLVQSMVAQDERQRPPNMHVVARILQQIGEEASSTGMPQNAPATPMTPSPPASSKFRLASPQPAVGIPLDPTRPVPSMSSSPPSSPTVPQPPRIGMPALQPGASALWTPAFRTFFAVLLLVTLVGSASAIYAVHAVGYGWGFIAASLLALVEFIMLVVASRVVRDTLPKSILVVTGITTLLTGFAALSLGSLDVQQAIGGVLSVSVLGQLLVVGFVATALVSLAWLARPFSVMWRVILAVLFVVAGICMLVGAPLSISNLTKYILLLLAFILLIQGSLLAVRMEQVR